MGLCLVFSFMFLTFSPQELPLFAAFGRIVGIFLSFRRPSAFFRTKKSQQSGLRPQIKAVPSGIRSKKMPEKTRLSPKKARSDLRLFFSRIIPKNIPFLRAFAVIQGPFLRAFAVIKGQKAAQTPCFLACNVIIEPKKWKNRISKGKTFMQGFFCAFGT